MVEFNVGGILLDVPQNLNIDFKKKNILFAFDSIELERTTSFKLPKTPTNLRVFNFSNDLHRVGTAMRKRVFAQFQSGIVTKKGYIYVSGYDYKSEFFECIFVTGEFLGLKELKELGAADELGYDENLSVRYNDLTNINIVNMPDFRVLRSYATDGAYRPSYRLSYILDWLMNKTSVTVDAIPRDFDIILTNPNPVQPTTFSITQEIVSSGQPTEPPISSYYNSIFTSSNVNAMFDFVGYDQYNGEPTVVLGVQRYYRVRFLRAKMDMIITFPSNFPDVFMYGMRDTYGGMVFYGDYSFSVSNYTMTKSGSPLAGRTVSLKNGDAFIFVDSNDYQMIPPSTSGGLSVPASLGFYPLISLSNFEGMTIEAEGDLKAGDVIYLRDNMPALTATDILKIFAYLNGKVLWYDNKSKRVTFENLDVYNYRTIIFDKVISVTNLRRTFGDYAQENKINFDSPEGMRSADYIQAFYSIDNDNIEQSKELYTIPFSEGRRYGDSNAIAIRSEDNDTIAVPVLSALSGRLYRVDIEKNSVLQSILTNSTTIDVQVEMTLFEYNSIQDKVRIFYDFAYWVWIDAVWSNGVARFTLAKV